MLLFYFLCASIMQNQKKVFPFINTFTQKKSIQQHTRFIKLHVTCQLFFAQSPYKMELKLRQPLRHETFCIRLSHPLLRYLNNSSMLSSQLLFLIQDIIVAIQLYLSAVIVIEVCFASLPDGVNKSLHIMLVSPSIGNAIGMFSPLQIFTRSLGALRAPTSRWRPFRPLDFSL